MSVVEPEVVVAAEAVAAPALPVEADLRHRWRPLIRSLVTVGLYSVCDVLAVLAIVLIGVDRTAAEILAAAAVVLVLAVPPTPRRLLRGFGPTGRGVLPRSALAIVGALLLPVSPIWLAVVLVCASLQLEPIAGRLARAAIPLAANLPGFRARNAGVIAKDRLFVINTVVVIVVVGVSSAGWGAVPALVASALALAVTAVVCVDAGLRVRARHRADPAIVAALTAHAPRFALHWDATPGTEYQIAMWLPYLERIGTPFVLVLRNPATFESIAASTSAPVLVRRDPADLDAVAVPTLGTVFYVNNAARNTHFVRFAGLEHVQLGHGESDKAPSYSPVFRLYTHAFVSGPAAVDRFANNGVRIPPETFTVVGRPQVTGTLVGGSNSSRPTALYAPTWAGANADSSYSSLPIGVPIVAALLEHGYRVLYRPHPYTRRSAVLAEQSDRIDALLATDARSTGRPHLDSEQTAALDLHACFDAADLLVSDVSSVVADFLHTEKPYLLTAMATDGTALQEESAIATSAYLVGSGAEGLDDAIRLAAGPDPMLQARRAVKAYVLGDHGDADPADVFVAAARAVVLGVPVRTLAA